MTTSPQIPAGEVTPRQRLLYLKEAWGPHAAAALLGAALYYATLQFGPPQRDVLDRLLDAGLNVGAVMAGFLLAAKAIILSSSNHWIMEQFRAAGRVPQLVRYFMTALWCSAALMLVSVAGLVLVAHYEHWVLLGLALVGAWCVSTTYRAIKLAGIILGGPRILPPS